MGLEVYYTQDIHNALLAAEQASNAAMMAASGDDKFTQGFQTGYRAALATIALAFGLFQPGDRDPLTDTLQEAVGLLPANGRGRGRR